MGTMPAQVFPVYWRQPDGEPIKFRAPGEPVQGEPAFDPFALMDEQPNSSDTMIRLAPVGREVIHESSIELSFLDDALRNESGDNDAEIGCCGFPRYKSRVP